MEKVTVPTQRCHLKHADPGEESGASLGLSPVTFPRKLLVCQQLVPSQALSKEPQFLNLENGN